MEEKKYNTDYAYVIPAAGTPQCNCARCRCRGLMGPAVLVTLGVLFLLSEFNVAQFHRTWPILLIVIGLVKVLGGSTAGHIEVLPPGAASAAQPQNPEPRQVDHV